MLIIDQIQFILLPDLLTPRIPKMSRISKSHIKNWSSFIWTCLSCKSSSTWACSTTTNYCSQLTSCYQSCCTIRKTARFPPMNTVLVSGPAGSRSSTMLTSLPFAQTTLLALYSLPPPFSTFIIRCCSFLLHSLPFSAPSLSLRPFSALTLTSRWSIICRFSCGVLPLFSWAQFVCLIHLKYGSSSPQDPNFEFIVFP